MISLTGNCLLVFSIATSILAIFTKRSIKAYIFWVSSLAIITAFLLLILAFITSDFSVKNVFGFFQKNLRSWRLLLSPPPHRLEFVLASGIKNYSGHSNRCDLLFGKERTHKKKSVKDEPTTCGCLERNVRWNKKRKLNYIFFAKIFFDLQTI